MNEIHRITRSLQKLHHGDAVAMERRRAELGWDELQEIEQQFQIPIEGSVGSGSPINLLTGFGFDVEFFDATEQRDSPFTVPHFTYGVVLDAEAADAMVCVHACVSGWDIDESRNAVVGANVNITIFTVGFGGAFEGYVHAVFQGFGARIESDEAMNIDVG